PDARRDRPVPVLGDGGTGAGSDDRGGRREVEEIAPEASRAARVEQRRPLRRDAAHAPPQGGDRPGDLVRRLAPRRDAEEDRALLGLGRLAVHEISESGFGEIARERPAADDDAQGLGDMRGHGVVPRRRKFSRSRSPSGVRTDSGWNWTPKTGLPFTASPMTR